MLQVTPLAVTPGAAMLYGEQVGWRRWAAALTGFLGVVLIVKPGGSFGTAVYVRLTALLFTTTRDLTTRGLHHDIPSIFVAAASAAAITLAGLLVIPFDDAWTMPSGLGLGLMTVSAACLFVANTFMIMALRTGEIAVVAPFRYAPVPLSLLLGYCGGTTCPMRSRGRHRPGAGAGLYTLHRERRAWRRAPPRPAPPNGAHRMKPNRMKEKIARGEPALGCSVMFPSPQVVEMLGFAGFDWVLIDCEHGSIGPADVELMAMACDAVGITPIAPARRPMRRATSRA